MKCKLYHIFLFCFLPFSPLFAQTDTLKVGDGFKETPANSHFAYFNTGEALSADSAWKVFTHQPGAIRQLDKINFGPINGYYWLTLTLKNVSNQKQELFLDIRQPHLYRLVFYRVEGDSVNSMYETGIHFNFYQRPTHHRFFDFPISCERGESFTMLVMVQHYNSLSLPMWITTRETLHENSYSQNLLWGFWTGFLSFCAVFALVAALLLRRVIFIWYFLYILSAAAYGFTSEGFGFQYLFPGLADFDAPAIIQLGTYGFIFLIKFSQGLLETRKYLPRVHKMLNILFYFILALIVAGWLFGEFMFRYSTVIIPIINIVMLTGLSLLAYSGVKALFTNRIIGIFYLVAYGTLVAASGFSIMTYAFGATQYFDLNPVLIAYFFEAMLLSVALVILFRQIQRERSALMVQVSTQQKQMYQQYIDGIEKERSRIAGELHDDIGSRLSHLKRGIQQSAESASGQLDGIINDIRMLSHDLAPPAAHVSGLMPLVEKLIVVARKNSSVDIKLQQFDYQERLQPNQIQQVYRILQELLHNITAHSKAGRADIQLFGYDDHLNITVEDDGIGFNIDQHRGFGINQVTVRTESLGGRIEINSRPGKGTQVLIEIPYL